MNAVAGTGARIMGPALTWFAVLGGAAAWSVLTLAVWGLNEFVCGEGAAETGPDLLGLPFVGVAAVITAACAVTAAAAGLAAWRLLGLARSADDRLPEHRAGRLKFMAAVGLGSDLLHLAIILYVGVALVFFGPCTR